MPGSPVYPSSGVQSFKMLRSSLNRTGLVRNRFIPLENASCCAVADARPVKAIINAGGWPRSRSKARISRADSIPFITGIVMSASRLACFDTRRHGSSCPLIRCHSAAARFEMPAEPRGHLPQSRIGSCASSRRFREAVRVSVVDR
jgi:hypothetical protein